jgi:hypothetical protein
VNPNLLFLLVLLILLYFAPAIVAFDRGKRNARAILAFNLFLGWTLFGWMIALVWACGRKPARLRPATSSARTGDKGPALYFRRRRARSKIPLLK